MGNKSESNWKILSKSMESSFKKINKLTTEIFNFDFQKYFNLHLCFSYHLNAL